MYMKYGSADRKISVGEMLNDVVFMKERFSKIIEKYPCTKAFLQQGLAKATVTLKKKIDEIEL